jgi:hypothetical protein
MTDLQLGLLVIGALAIGGVVLYNRLQERAARRRVEGAFTGRPGDALLEAEEGRREPRLHGASRHAERREPMPQGTLPDGRFDYVIELAPARPASAADVLGQWGALEHRFARRAVLAAADEHGGWRGLEAGDSGHCVALRAGLQLASRDGAVSEADLLEFRSAVETLATRLGATVSAPQMREAVDAARELDAFCAEADIQVALHVVPAAGTAPFTEQRAARARDGAAGGPFAVELRRATTSEVEAITLTMDVPRAPDVVRSFEAMARSGRQLAETLGGRLVDDNQNVLDERSLATIATQLETVRRRLADHGIEPGGELALRLFS